MVESEVSEKMASASRSTAEGSCHQSPVRPRSQVSPNRGRAKNRRTEGREEGVVPQYLFVRSSSKDNVLIDKFRGKPGEDVERFLRAVQRRMSRNLEMGKYYSENEQKDDHVAIIHRHCGSRVREYIRNLKGNWEEEPERVREALACRYRTFGASALNTGRDKIASLHQKVDEPLDRHIRRAQQLTVVCQGREDMHEELTDRFCRGLREKGHRNSLASMVDIWSQSGQVRFETCMANAHRIARSDISFKEALLMADSESEPESSDDSSTDSDLSEDDRKYLKKRKEKEKRRRKEWKQKTRGRRRESRGGIRKARLWISLRKR